MTDKETTGVSFEAGMIERLDELKRERDERRTEAVSRSTVIQELVEIGLAADEIIEDHNPDLAPDDRRAVVRQATLDHFRDV